MIRTRSRLLALTLLSGLAFGQGAYAQSPGGGPGGKMYTNKQQFKLPFNLGEADRQKLREVQLFARCGTEPWACKETAAPTQTHFTFKAPQDGEYQFNIVTVDKTGRAVPPDVTQEPPALVVVVDTTPPDVQVSVPPPAARAAGEDIIRCLVRDANPDTNGIKLEYQAMDRTWQPLAPAGSFDQFRCPDPLAWSGALRVSVTDRAGNTVCKDVGPSPAPAPMPASAAGPLPPPGPLPFTDPGVSQADARTEKGPVPAAVQPTAYSSPAPGATSNYSPASRAARQDGARDVVNNLTTQINYAIDQVGPSGVGRVEVWLTADEGKTWQRHCEDADHASPVEVRLPGEGVFGVCIVVTNGNGVGDPPPGKGTQPQYWVEVDSTRPVAQITSVRPAGPEDPGAVQINWNAADKNFGGEPIDLYYATRKEGPWVPVARGLKNDGSYRWSVPRDAGPEFYFRLEAMDRAGNKAVVDATQPVVLDLSRPRARVLGISTVSGPRPTQPVGN